MPVPRTWTWLVMFSSKEYLHRILQVLSIIFWDFTFNFLKTTVHVWPVDLYIAVMGCQLKYNDTSATATAAVFFTFHATRLSPWGWHWQSLSVSATGRLSLHSEKNEIGKQAKANSHSILFICLFICNSLTDHTVMTEITSVKTAGQQGSELR